MFSGLPDPYPLVRGMDPDPAMDPVPSIILLSSRKNSKENLDSYCLVTSFKLFAFKNSWKCTFKKCEQDNVF